MTDLHAVACSWGCDNLTAAMAQLAAIYADVDERNARNTATLALPCHAGCDACCHECVFLTPLEFLYAWNWVQTHLSEATRTQLVAAHLALYAQHRDLIEAFDAPPPDGHADHTVLATQLRFRCPFLSTSGTCSIYAARELYARLFGASFLQPGVVYGCHLVENHLAGKTVTLLPTRATARRLHALPLTHKRQVYPYYVHQLYGAMS